MVSFVPVFTTSVSPVDPPSSSALMFKVPVKAPSVASFPSIVIERFALSISIVLSPDTVMVLPSFMPTASMSKASRASPPFTVMFPKMLIDVSTVIVSAAGEVSATELIIRSPAKPDPTSEIVRLEATLLIVTVPLPPAAPQVSIKPIVRLPVVPLASTKTELSSAPAPSIESPKRRVKSASPFWILRFSASRKYTDTNVSPSKMMVSSLPKPDAAK